MQIGHYLYSASGEAITKDRPLQQLLRLNRSCPDSIVSMQKCVVNALEKVERGRERERVRPYLVIKVKVSTFSTRSKSTVGDL